MRRRSSTFHADNVDEFLNAAQKFDAIPHPFKKSKSKRHSKNSQTDKKNSAITGNPFEKSTNDQESLEDYEQSWDDFDFDCENVNLNNNHRISKTMPSLTLSDNTVDTDCSEDVDVGLPKGVKSSILRRVMVIGMNGSGKHSLINEIFNCEEQIVRSEDQVMDLMTKTEEDEDERSQVRYQFWIQNLYCEGDARKDKMKELIRVYYKNVSLFMFMYSITDKKSFECLESAINSVKNEIPAEKFNAILLGTRNDIEEQREVAAGEGISLQDKHKLKFFMETNHGDKSLKQKFVQVLREKEGAPKDLGTQKGYSILSTD